MLRTVALAFIVTIAVLHLGNNAALQSPSFINPTSSGPVCRMPGQWW
jgi:hypothetical protein